MLRDEGGDLRPRRERVERLHETGPDERARAEPLAARPAGLLKLVHKLRDLWRVEKLRDEGGDRAARYTRTGQGGTTPWPWPSEVPASRGPLFYALTREILEAASDGIAPPAAVSEAA